MTFSLDLKVERFDKPVRAVRSGESTRRLGVSQVLYRDASIGRKSSSEFTTAY
jgi:hypothetical protein